MNMIKHLWVLPLLSFAFFTSCQGNLKETECSKIRVANRVEKSIQRKSHDQLIAVSTPEVASQAAYPWQTASEEKFPRITKEYFRCQGNREHASYLKGEERLFDCAGSSRHSLPLKEGSEYVYPVLINILNFLQERLDAPVVITCGHRCPQHNRYSDPSEYNRTSKHMIGAEVDFYVQGYESRPEEVISAILEFYQKPEYQKKESYQRFERYTKKDLNTKTPAWFNQEIFVKLYQPHEGRDQDNTHNMPYVSIQVRYDPKDDKRVTYTWQQAFYNYLRY